jgi:hypothetical protein
MRIEENTYVIQSALEVADPGDNVDNILPDIFRWFIVLV